ncbi:MAG: alkaline phosphatase D family protein [Geminicoccaceae bacterium]
MKRRELLVGATGAGVAAGLSGASLAQGRFNADPFVLGVASSTPRPHAVTLWTRLAPRPQEPTGGIDPVAVPVDWELASDDAFGEVVARGTGIALPELAHSVRVTVDGLEPGRSYWYRFVAGDAESMTGRTRTLPASDANLNRVRFATTSCQHYEQGLFVAYDRMIEDDPDFVVHLGDFIYGVSRGDFRNHSRKEEPATLEDFRLRHALYASDESLKRARASFPFYTVLDNHDALKDVDLDPAALVKRVAAYQAWYEHMPMAGGYTAGAASLYSHGGADFGDLLRLTVMDTRQFREDEDLCREFADPDFGFTIYRPACDPVQEEARSMLGAAQEAWVAGRMAGSRQRWNNSFASTVLFSPFAMGHAGDRFVYESSWDYYPANRRRFLASVQDTGLSNPVILSADIHSNWAIDVTENPDDPESRTIGSEFLATSLASGWPPPLDEPIKANLTNNPHVHHYRGDQRGYMMHEVTPESWTTDMRVVDTILTTDARVSSQARFAVEAGRPGAQKA